MALSSDNDMVMPVTPMNGGYGNGFGGCFGGDSWAWFILLILLAGNNGWGNNNGSNGVMPYMWNSQTQNEVSRGFDNAAVTNQLSSINSAITSGFAGAEISRANAATNILQGFNGVQSQLAQCCCENRLASANLSSDLAREACANRTALADSTQKILDQMCQDKIDAKNERIADLERQLTLANLAASQGAQTAQILADNARQTSVLEDYLNPVARPAYIVANPNCCQQNIGCGCNGF